MNEQVSGAPCALRFCLAKGGAVFLRQCCDNSLPSFQFADPDVAVVHRMAVIRFGVRRLAAAFLTATVGPSGNPPP